MQHYSVYFFAAVFLLFQDKDYSGWAAPVLALLATGVTIYGQIRQSKMQTTIKEAQLAQKAQAEVIEAWRSMVKTVKQEQDRSQRRIRISEHHTRVCEKSNLLLVAQLIKAGVPIDFEKIMSDMSKYEADIATIERLDLHVETVQEKREAVAQAIADEE